MQNDKHNIHDRTAKFVFSQPKMARAFLEAHLPGDLKLQLNLNSLKMCKSSFVDPILKEHLTDVLYQVKAREKTGYIYTLIELQSAPDRLMPFRLLQYCVQIMRHHLDQQRARKQKEKLPFIFPMVYYNGKSTYQYSTDLFDLFEEPQLARKHFLKPFTLLMVMLEYLLKVGDLKTPAIFLNEVAKQLPQLEEKIMTGADYLKKEGRQEGKKEGVSAVAKKLLKAKQSISFVSKMTGLKVTELRKLEKSLQASKAA